MFKTRQTFTISASFWIVFLAVFLWLSTRSKPHLIHLEYRTLPQNISISSELASLPNRLGCLWTSTRDNILRKSTWPSKSNYRYMVCNLILRKIRFIYSCVSCLLAMLPPILVPAKINIFGVFPSMLRVFEAKSSYLMGLLPAT